MANLYILEDLGALNVTSAESAIRFPIGNLGKAER
jgi:hypothetical protein